MPYRVPSPIREARMRAGLSQRQLARQIHVENVTISGWENGHYRPSPRRAVALCRALPGLTLGAIYLHAAFGHP